MVLACYVWVSFQKTWPGSLLAHWSEASLLSIRPFSMQGSIQHWAKWV
jgi:hypothetical protein